MSFYSSSFHDLDDLFSHNLQQEFLFIVCFQTGCLQRNHVHSRFWLENYCVALFIRNGSSSQITHIPLQFILNIFLMRISTHSSRNIYCKDEGINSFEQTKKKSAFKIITQFCLLIAFFFLYYGRYKGLDDALITNAEITDSNVRSSFSRSEPEKLRRIHSQWAMEFI